MRIERPIAKSEEDTRLWREVQKFARLIPSEAEPNLGRVREIKEEIKKGNYPTPEVIEGAAANLVIRLLKREF